MASSTPSPKASPYVLSASQIAALPLEGSPNKHHFTGQWKQLISSPLTPTDSMNLGIAHFPPRTETEESFGALHRHAQAEFYYILAGEGVVRISGADHDVRKGHVLFIPGDAEHGFWNTSYGEELVFLYGFAVGGFGEVVYRFSGEGGKVEGTELVDLE
jgi:mannose-6-phosphate isomerase-like protein (cupin superfamily)